MAACAVLDDTRRRGRTPPRVELQPPEVYNAVDEAIDFYEQFGRRADWWQCKGLQVGLGENADGSWACFEAGLIVSRQSGKGLPAEVLITCGLFLWGYKKIVYSAHRGKTVKQALDSFKELVKNNPDLARRCKPINDSDDTITLLTGAEVQFVTRTGSGGRGLTGDLVIIDEALKLEDEAKASLVPTLAAIPNAQLWYMSTVPTYAEQHLCTVRERVLAGAPRLGWAEWTADDEAADDPNAVHDRVQLQKANPGAPHRISFERLHDLLGILGEKLFRTECMGIWPTARKDTLLNPVVWGRMVDVGSRRNPAADAVIAFDCTPLLDHGSIGLHSYREDGLEMQILLDYDQGIDWMVDRLVWHKEIIDPVLFVVDGANGAMSLLDRLAEKGIRRAEDPKKLQRGDLVVLELREMADAVAQYVEGFRKTPTIYRHWDQEPLNKAVGNVKPRNVGEGKIAYGRRKSDVDIGPVTVVTEGRYGHTVWATRRAPAKARSKVW